jgi:methionyl aminopeptidase
MSKIVLKSSEDLKKMRRSGKILAEVFRVVETSIKVGMSAEALDQLIYNAIIKLGAKPSFLGYRGYKHSSCISKNEEVVHGIPHPDKLFFPGDICSVDIGVYYEGFHTDAARTFMLEVSDPEVIQLVTVTEESFFKAIEQARPGNRLGDMSHALQAHVEAAGFSVVRDLYSHGVGHELHEEPLIPNYGKRGQGLLLKEGMTFAIEPMVNIGRFDVLTLADKWTIIAADRKWSAHYENTIFIGADGPEILTLN